MPRPLPEILSHLRAAIADQSIAATLLQTEDLEVLCDAAEAGAEGRLRMSVLENARLREEIAKLKEAARG